MVSQITYAILFSFLLLLPLHKANVDATQREKITHLHFYFHEIMSGPNATLVNVVAPLTNTSFFGMVGIIDDMLREGADPDSKLIGRAQGTVVGASQEADNGIFTSLNFVFTDGPYNGSTLAIFGRVVLGSVIDRTIIGGSGVFRMARGYSIGKFLSSAPNTLIVEFDNYVYHY